MEIDAQAPARAEASGMLRAPADAAWDVLADLEGWPAWMPGVSRVDASATPVEGRSWRWKANGMRITSTFERVDRPQVLGWSGRMVGVRARHVWRFEPVEGGTRVHTEESWDGPLVRLLPGRMGTLLRQALEDGVRALVAETERRASSGSG